MAATPFESSLSNTILEGGGGGATTVLTIEELGVDDPKILMLFGSGLPHKGAEWKATSAVVTTWYNGNAVATQQVVGPREAPSTWSGTWKRTMLSRTPAYYGSATSALWGPGKRTVVQPSELRKAIDNFRIGGALLRVTWSTDSVREDVQDKVVREGRITDFTFTPDNLYDYQWSITFDWISRGQAKPVPVSTRDDSLSNAVSAYESAQLAIDIAMKAQAYAGGRSKLGSGNVFTLGQLEALSQLPMTYSRSIQRTMRQATTQLNRLLNVVTSVPRTPYDIAQEMVTLARGVEGAAFTFSQTTGRIPTELLTNVHSAGSQLQAKSFFAGVERSVSVASRNAAQIAIRFARMKHQAAQRREDTYETNASNVLATHIVRDGDTPSKLSCKYYKNPDYAWLICKANKMPWTQMTLPTGSILTIPTLSTISART